MRRAAKVDTAQPHIIDALRKAGVQVWVIKLPCDLLTLYHGRWLPLECKTASKTGRIAKDKRQADQIAFLEQTSCPVVSTPEEALLAVSVYGER